MRFLTLFLISSALFLSNRSGAQRIVYSEPSNDDTRRTNFEIIGKVQGNFLIYKQNRNKNIISVYNTDMEELGRVEQDYMPKERLINIDFFPYADFTYAVYQYQKKNVVYCDAVKVNGEGKRISDIIHLDTTNLSLAANNKVYTAISSENKSKVMIFKVNSRNRSNFIITSLLFDSELSLLKRSRFSLKMEENNDVLDEFNIDNDGDLVFTRYNRNYNETITKSQLVWKKADADTLHFIDIPHEEILLDKPVVKVDNFNKRYFLTSFYYLKKRGNIEGFYFYAWDKTTMRPTLENAVVLEESLRREARGDANMKTAFNDYFVRNVIIKKDGGFIINTESFYTTSRGNAWNRWNYLYGSPFNTWDYYNFAPGYNNWWWRNNRFNNQQVRSHADNITILSFDNSGKLEWNSVIRKSQFDDESDEKISFLHANTGNQIHYLFNTDERRILMLNDFTLTPGGQISQNPTLKNLDRGYEFLPKFGKQVSVNQLVIPCFYRNYLCFAKIEFN
jgi:hypothetical protein